MPLDEIVDNAEKQQFLKALYEDFYKAYNPAAADRMGVVYTPNEVVDFIIRGTDHLLQKHFGRTLADDNVQILDPATGTGTFVANLINYLPLKTGWSTSTSTRYTPTSWPSSPTTSPISTSSTPTKSARESYLEFPNLCFVDTLDNMDWQGAGATGRRRRTAKLLQPRCHLRRQLDSHPVPEREAHQRHHGQPTLQRQPAATLRGDNNAEPFSILEIDKPHQGNLCQSRAPLRRRKQYDMYKRFIRWASDRLTDDGVIAFVTNRAYLDTHVRMMVLGR